MVQEALYGDTTATNPINVSWAWTACGSAGMGEYDICATWLAQQFLASLRPRDMVDCADTPHAIGAALMDCKCHFDCPGPEDIPCNGTCKSIGDCWLE